MWKIRLASALLATILTVASPAAQPPSGASPGDDALVLVVPFANLAGDPADDWIGVGIAEAVAIDLQVTGTPVVRATVEVRGDTGPGGVLDVARQAGSGRVLSGAYQRSGDLIRVTARLLDVAEGTVLRSATVTGMATEIFELQDRVAAELRTEAGSPSHRRRRRRMPRPSRPHRVPCPDVGGRSASPGHRA